MYYILKFVFSYLISTSKIWGSSQEICLKKSLTIKKPKTYDVPFTQKIKNMYYKTFCKPDAFSFLNLSLNQADPELLTTFR